MSREYRHQHQLPLYLLFIGMAMEVTDDFSMGPALMFKSLQMVQGKHLTLLTSTGRLLLHQRAYSYRFTALKGEELGGGVQHFVLQRALQVLAVRWVQLQLTPTQPP